MSINPTDSNHKEHSFIYKPISAFSKVYTPQLSKVKRDAKEGDYGSATVRAAQFAIQAPFTLEMVRDSYDALKNPSSMTLYKPASYLGDKGTKVSNWTFMPDSFKQKLAKGKIGKNFAPVANNLDRSLISTKLGDSFIKTIDKNAEVVTKGGEVLVKGSKSAVRAGNVLGKVPVLGTMFSAAMEMPKVIKAAQNGDGRNQLGRSALNIAGGTIGCAVLGTATACLIPPFGGFIGAAVGGAIAGKISEKIGNKVFGPPKDDNKFTFVRAGYSSNIKMS